MATKKVRFWNSLVTRFAVFFAGLNVLAILAVGFLVYDQAASVITSYSQDRMRYSSNLAAKSFNSLLNEVANDIAVTTNNPILGRFIGDPEEATLEDLTRMFSVILENKPNYFQIRLLDVNDNGKELIRYDKQQGRVIRTPDDKLQFKGDRLYYQEALKTPRGTYYYSDINLNEEFGKVSLPHIPTLRAVGKIYNGNEALQALLVINVNLSEFYQELNQIMESDYRLLLLNEAGDYLFAPEMEKCFGNQLNSGISFTKDFVNPVDSLLNLQNFGFIKDKTGRRHLYHLESLNYSPGQQIYLVSMLADNLLFRSAYLVRNDSIKLVLLACAISLMVVFFFSKIFSGNIKQITQAVSSYEEGSEEQIQKPTLPENRQDELGVLARAFARMRNRIDRQLTDLKSALSREQQAIKERDQFLQNMSHELRTPLNAMLGLARLLNKNKPSKAQQPIINSLERSAVNLSGLMHDLLDHQKLLEGKIHLNLSVENFNSLLSDIHAGYRYEAINKGLSFTLDIQDSLKDHVFYTDPLRFNQIITNLVVNAIKFTPSGFVTLKAGITHDDPPRMKVQLIDSGQGIRPKNLQKIKERFYQERNRQASNEEGYGLGLSIVKQLVDLFGGGLDVTSELNQGSNFTVYFPLIPANHSDVNPTVLKPEDSLPKLKNNYNLLHIEDDPSTLLLVSHALDLPNVSIQQLEQIDETSGLPESIKPDLILSDLMMDSRSIDSFLLNELNHTKIPLLLISAFEPPRMKAITPYFLQKPFEITELRNLVIMLLGRNEYQQPQLETIYEQYDHQPDKIRNFLNILQQEFMDYVRRFDKVSITRDEKELKAIMHKLTTHVKSMSLDELSKLLPTHPSQLDEARADAIRNNLLYCLCVFQYESKSKN
ncbi:MAG: hypothetical protein DHS20C17_29990 [Cyclobacteriaceae bacterium]|nr:MAG: hypothetical protein DHS20C17_29990 [Cyclobacteriaceae bacterium]